MTISDTAKPAPILLQSCRKGRSVTPAIGATNSWLRSGKPRNSMAVGNRSGQSKVRILTRLRHLKQTVLAVVWHSKPRPESARGSPKAAARVHQPRLPSPPPRAGSLALSGQNGATGHAAASSARYNAALPSARSFRPGQDPSTQPTTNLSQPEIACHHRSTASVPRVLCRPVLTGDSP